MKTLVVLAIVLVGLAGCGGSDEEKPQGVIPGHMVESMEEAKHVEDVLEQAEQQRREQIDE